MEPTEVLEQAKDVFTTKRVIGDPYEKNGVTLIPVVAVAGGGGGGGGNDAESRANGFGGGLGMMARPVGAFVIKGESVEWLPSIDVTRVIVGGQLVAIVMMLVIRSIVRSRTHRARSPRHSALEG